MIVKKIQAKNIQSKAAYAYQLTDYMLRLNGNERGESLLYSGGFGFICQEHSSMQAELAALASESPRSANPVVHWILSWKEDEQPTSEQVEKAVHILLENLGLRGHQCIWAVHEETHNLHGHVAINRVHPDSGKVISAANGFDIDAAHRAIAEIEWLQGWQPEPNALYSINENGEKIRNKSRIDSTRSPSSGARNFERWGGRVSSHRQAVEVAATLIRKSKSWIEMHEALGAHGMCYKPVGSGAVLEIDGISVKASSSGRDCSHSQLIRRFGPYQNSSSPVGSINDAQKQNNLQQPVGLNEYEAAKERRSFELDQERKLLLVQQRAQYMVMIERHCIERSELKNLRILNVIHKSDLKVKRGLLAAQHASERAWLKEQQAKERNTLKTKFPRIDDFESWLRDTGQGALADDWRNRERICLKFIGHTFSEPYAQDIRDFRAKVCSAGIQYIKHDSAGTNSASFIDTGSAINVLDPDDRSAILAAMQLAQQKWGGFKVEGHPAFKRACIELAAEHGFMFTDEIMQSEAEIQKLSMKKSRQSLRRNATVNDLVKNLAQSDADAFEIVATKRASDQSILVRERLEIEKGEVTKVAGDSIIQKLTKVTEWGEAGYTLGSTQKRKIENHSESSHDASIFFSNVSMQNLDCETAYIKCHELLASVSKSKVVDISRVDADIAINMSKNGYRGEDVEHTIFACAKKFHHPGTDRDWRRYSKRVVAYAYRASNHRRPLDISEESKNIEISTEIFADHPLKRTPKPK